MGRDDVTRVGRPRLFPEQLGPCRLVRILGVGGMGAVYLAEMTEDRRYAVRGTSVAVKVLHPDLQADAQNFRRFQREAEIGTALEHPSVVRTHDADIAVLEGDRYHYLVLEYVEGRTLAQLLDLLKVLPEALLRDVGTQVAAGLAALHEVGAVHRDLKPSNVLLTPDHQVKLMDLGIAHVVTEAARMTGTGDFVGTLHYAAPEQFEGVDVGPHSDLYALGVVLYEAATGVQPFAAKEFPAVMKRHLELVPDKAGTLNPQVTPFFEEVLDCLLEKNPRRRFGSAEELARVLEQGEDSSWWQDREITVRARHPRGELRRTRVPTETSIVGRQAELERLDQAYAEASGGEGRLVLVEGEAGVGKSRLVEEFLARLEEHGEDAHVLHGAHPPGSAGAAPGALSQAVIGHFGRSDLEHALERYLSVTPRLVPAFVAFLTGQPPPDGSEPLSPEALHAVFCHLASSLSAQRPVVWVVEDVHFGSEEALDRVLAMARAAHDQRLLLLTTTRPTLPAEALANIQRLEVARRLPLRRLEAADVVAILREASGSDTLVEDVGRLIVGKSDGNPYFVFEMLRELKEMDLLEERPDGTLVALRGIHDVTVPSTVKELLHARLAELAEEDRQLLDVGAVQGFSFDADLVARVLGRRRLEVLQALAAVERRSGVVRATGAGFRFDHHLLQEVVEDEIPPVLCAEYHLELARAYEEREGIAGRPADELSGEAALFVAEHALRGRSPEKAAPLILPALDHLARGYQTDAVLELADLAVSGLGEGRPALRCDVRLRQAEALDLLGRRGAQRAAVEDAIASAEAAADTRRLAEARCQLGWLLIWLSRHDEAEGVLEEALADARAVSDRRVEARTISNLGLVCFHRGRHPEARDHHERDLAICRGTDDRRGEGRATLNLGLLALRSGDHAEALARLEEALRVFREIGHRQGEAIALANLGLVFRCTGRLDRARECLTQAVSTCRGMAYRHGEAHALVRLGPSIVLEEGRLEEAERHVAACLEMARVLNARGLEALALIGSGRVAWARGEQDEARRLMEQGLRLARELDERESVAEGALALGRLLASTGELRDEEPARELLAEAQRVAGELGVPEVEVVASARLAVLGARDPSEVVVDERVAVPARAEALLALHRATGDASLREQALQLLERTCSHLEESEREAFWRHAPSARLARA